LIVPIDQVQTLSPRGMIYALPKTNLRIKVESVQISIIAGPYAPFAQKYLGISNVTQKSSTVWKISDIEVFSVVQPDMDALFVVEPSPDFSVDFLRLSQEGLIIPANAANFYSVEHKLKLSPESLADDYFVDLSATPFIAAEQTTHYSRVFQDSTFIRVPVHKTVVVEKSLEDKAREAADFIFTLRKRRMELISGDADFVAEGKAAEAILNEISRLEDEYLSLFVGKKQTYSATNWYDFIPSEKSNGAEILFRFSSAKGVLPSSDLSGSPVLITISPETNWQNIDLLNSLSLEKDIQRTDVVYYRLPVPISIKINDSQTELFSQKLTFFQFGPLVRMPAHFILNDNGKILFPKK
jgi:hypothetical protein